MSASRTLVLQLSPSMAKIRVLEYERTTGVSNCLLHAGDTVIVASTPSELQTVKVIIDVKSP